MVWMTNVYVKNGRYHLVGKGEKKSLCGKFAVDVNSVVSAAEDPQPQCKDCLALRDGYYGSDDNFNRRQSETEYSKKRRQLGLTQAQLAELLGYSVGHIAHLDQGVKTNKLVLLILDLLIELKQFNK